MDFRKETIEIGLIQANSGQLQGLPANPRRTTLKDLQALEKSLRDFPDFLEVRPLIVIAHEDGYVAIAGNHRLKAANNIGLKSLPCIVLSQNTPKRQLREIALKDNKEYAQLVPDLLETWDLDELGDWDILPELALDDLDFEIKEPKKAERAKELVCPKCGYKWKK